MIQAKDAIERYNKEYNGQGHGRHTEFIVERKVVEKESVECIKIGSPTHEYEENTGCNDPLPGGTTYNEKGKAEKEEHAGANIIRTIAHAFTGPAHKGRTHVLVGLLFRLLYVHSLATESLDQLIIGFSAFFAVIDHHAATGCIWYNHRYGFVNPSRPAHCIVIRQASFTLVLIFLCEFTFATTHTLGSIDFGRPHIGNVWSYREYTRQCYQTGILCEGGQRFFFSIL